MTSQWTTSDAAYEQAARMVSALDEHLALGPTCPEDKRAIEETMATLTDTYSALWCRAKAVEEDAQRAQATLETLTSELQEKRDTGQAVTQAFRHHRAFISSLTRRIAVQGQEDVAAPPLPGSIEAETRQMERFKLINELAVAGEEYARMNIKWRKMHLEGANLIAQITEETKATKVIFEKAKAFRATESLLGKDLIRRTRRAEEFGCVIAAPKLMEDENSRGEAVGEEYGKSAGSEEEDSKKEVQERGEAHAGTER